MIRTLTGKITELAPPYITVDVNGVGYGVLASQAVLSQTSLNHDCHIHTYLHVREDILDLYGFINQEERSLFLALLSVSGIGPRSALAIVAYGTKHVQEALQQNNVAFFTAIPRIGKKNAQKILVELQSKIAFLDGGISTHHHDVLQALVNMGFPKEDIIQAMQKAIRPDDSLATQIKATLKALSAK